MSSINCIDFLRSHKYDITIATSPSPRDYRIGWIDNHNNHINLAKTSKAETIIIGDSIAYGLSRYNKVWQKCFAKNQTLNFGVPGDHTQHVLWRLLNVKLPDTLKYAIIFVGTNNLDHDKPENIANAILIIAYFFIQKHPNIKVVISGLLPREHSMSIKTHQIKLINDILSKSCSIEHNSIFAQPS